MLHKKKQLGTSNLLLICLHAIYISFCWALKFFIIAEQILTHRHTQNKSNQVHVYLYHIYSNNNHASPLYLLTYKHKMNGMSIIIICAYVCLACLRVVYKVQDQVHQQITHIFYNSTPDSLHYSTLSGWK